MVAKWARQEAALLPLARQTRTDGRVGLWNRWPRFQLGRAVCWCGGGIPELSGAPPAGAKAVGRGVPAGDRLVESAHRAVSIGGHEMPVVAFRTDRHSAIAVSQSGGDVGDGEREDRVRADFPAQKFFRLLDQIGTHRGQIVSLAAVPRQVVDFPLAG